MSQIWGERERERDSSLIYLLKKLISQNWNITTLRKMWQLGQLHLGEKWKGKKMWSGVDIIYLE